MDLRRLLHTNHHILPSNECLLWMEWMWMRINVCYFLLLRNVSYAEQFVNNAKYEPHGMALHFYTVLYEKKKHKWWLSLYSNFILDRNMDSYSNQE